MRERENREKEREGRREGRIKGMRYSERRRDSTHIMEINRHKKDCNI